MAALGGGRWQSSPTALGVVRRGRRAGGRGRGSDRRQRACCVGGWPHSGGGGHAAAHAGSTRPSPCLLTRRRSERHRHARGSVGGRPSMATAQGSCSVTTARRYQGASTQGCDATGVQRHRERRLRRLQRKRRAGERVHVMRPNSCAVLVICEAARHHSGSAVVIECLCEKHPAAPFLKLKCGCHSRW